MTYIAQTKYRRTEAGIEVTFIDHMHQTERTKTYKTRRGAECAATRFFHSIHYTLAELRAFEARKPEPAEF